MNDTIPSLINDTWPVRLLPHRTKFHADRPLWEHSRLVSMAERVQPGWTIYDVGAEEGDFTALYRTWVGDAGSIVAVEPSPGYWPAIRQTWEGNGFTGPALHCVPAFASSITERPTRSGHWTHEHEQLFSIDPDGWPPSSRGIVVPDAGFRHLAQQTAETPQLQLDAIPFAPDAIVLDIEGAEYDALVGCAGWCSPEWPTRPVVWVSVHDVGGDDWPGPLLGWYGKTADDLDALMDGYGYDRELLEAHGEGERFFVYTPR